MARLACVMALLVCGRAGGQELVSHPKYLVHNWNTEDGLPQNSVTGIAQTPDGYLWIGTFGGLARFDGVRFTTFHADVTPNFPLTSILVAATDREGRLWVSSVDEQMRCLTPTGFRDPAEWGLPPGKREFCGESPSGGVIIRARESNVVLRLEGDKFVPFGGSVPPTEALFDQPRLESRGGLWERRGTNFALISSYDSLTNLSRWQGAADDRLLGIGQGRQGSLWFVSQRHLRRLHQGSWTQDIAVDQALEGVSGVVEDDQGGVWIGCSQAGLFHASAQGEVERVSLTGSTTPETIRSLFQDREGNLWIGTDGSGLFRIKPRIFRLLGPKEGLTGTVVRTVSAGPDGNVWVLYHGGSMDRLEWPGPVVEAAYPKIELPWAALASRGGPVWIGLFGGNLQVASEGRLQPVPRASEFPGTSVRALYEDRVGVLWAGMARGLQRVENRQAFPVTDFPLPEPRVRSLTGDQQGNLYVGLGAGGGLWRRAGSKWERLGVTNGLAGEEINTLQVDRQNVLWMAVEKRGLVCLEGDRFRVVPTAKAALPDFVSVIIEDRSGHLWLGSSRGVYRVNRDAALAAAKGAGPEVHVDRYGRADGISTSESAGTQPAACETKDGLLCFATFNGVAVVDPQKVPSNPHPPPVHVEQVVYEGVVVGLTAADAVPGRPAGTDSLAQVTIPAGVTRVEIHYTALSFVTPGNVRFRYQLEGVDQGWVDAGANRLAYYTKLRPGTYRFRVTACNNDGVWNERGAMLALIARPFVWQTGWFRAGLAGGLLLLVYLYYRSRVNQLERQRAAQQEFSRRLIVSQEVERKRFAGELHDGLGQNLLAIKNRSTFGARREGVPPETAEQLRDIASLALSSIKEVREMTHALRPHLLDELGLTKAIESVIQRVARSSGVSFEARVDDLEGCLPPEFEINLFRVVQETINNVMKHAAATEVKVTLDREPGMLRLRVVDNGRGFDPAAARRVDSGMGLSSLAERARMMGGTIELTSAPGQGTTVLVNIPLQPRP